MSLKNLLKLPTRLIEAREKADVTQRALAAEMGVHPTHLCGVERGRRRVNQPDFLPRFVLALGLSSAHLSELRWALMHDQVIQHAHAVGLAEVELMLISLALQVGHELDGGERAGIERLLAAALHSKRVLRSYVSNAAPQQEGAAMT